MVHVLSSKIHAVFFRISRRPTSGCEFGHSVQSSRKLILNRLDRYEPASFVTILDNTGGHSIYDTEDKVVSGSIVASLPPST